MLISATVFLVFGCHSHGNVTAHVQAAGCTIFLSTVFAISDKLDYFLVGINLLPSLFQLDMFYRNMWN